MNLKSYFKKAQKGKWAIPQFNFSTLEQLRAILTASAKLKSPVILGTSEGESGFMGLEETIALFEIAKMKYKAKAFLNLDHGKDINLIKKAIDFGYAMVHFDGSNLPFKKNIQITKNIVKYAHKKGVLVEGELGYIEGESKVHAQKAKVNKRNLTSPEQVSGFIRQTKVDSLAVAVGNLHGVYKGGMKIDFKRLEEINKETNIALVLHGGSGIADSDIKKAIKMGIVKININTELRIVWKESLEKTFKKGEIKPYKILTAVQDLIQKKVEEKIILFDSKRKII